MLGRKAAAELTEYETRPVRRAGEVQPSTPPRIASTPTNDDRPPAIVIVHIRKMVQRQRQPQQKAKRIVTYTPKRQRDAWTRYLRLIGKTEEPPMAASPP